MADLIDRQKIKAKFEPWLKVTDYSEGELNMLKAVLYEITVMPSAQPERCEDCVNFSKTRLLIPQSADAVVRCKDCKYFDGGTDEDGKLFFKCLGWVYGGTNEDDFCSHGERKDG